MIRYFRKFCITDLKTFLCTVVGFLATLSPMSLVGCETSLKDFPRVLIRGDSAVIVVHETRDPKAILYYVSRQDETWDLRQTIDLTPYLDGWYCHFPSYVACVDRQGDELTNQIHSIAMNDHWLVICICECNTMFRSKGKSSMKQCGVLLFTKTGETWSFLSELVPENYLYDTASYNIPFIDLTDDDKLLIANPWHLEGERVGALYCYHLSNDSEPILCQTILPPKDQFYSFIDRVNKGGFFETGFATHFFLAGDFLLIPDETLPLLREPTKSDSYTPSKDMFVYEYVNGSWEYRFCYRDILGKDDEGEKLYYDYRMWHYTFSNACLYSYVGKKDFKKKAMVYEILKLKYADGKVQDVSTDSLVTDSLETQDEDTAPMLQLPDTYLLKWLGHYERFALTPPSDDQDGHFTVPKWTVFDSDERTYNLVADMLKNQHFLDIDRVGNKLVKVKKNSYKYAIAIPIVKHSIDKNRIITSYAFPHCYDDDYPTLQDAEVWAGVNIYEIDPETGPKRVFRMTTSHNRDLEVVPVSEEHP